MFEEVLKNSVAPVVIAALFLWFMDRAEKQRIENAKTFSQEQRTHESIVFNLFASAMKQMIGEVVQANKDVAEAIAQHEKASQDRYERNGNTQEILEKINEVRQQFAKQRKSE